jgi:hypothetical protein
MLISIEMQVLTDCFLNRTQVNGKKDKRGSRIVPKKVAEPYGLKPKYKQDAQSQCKRK